MVRSRYIKIKADGELASLLGMENSSGSREGHADAGSNEISRK